MWGPEPNAELLRLRAAEQEGRPHSIWLGRCPPGMEGSLLGAQAPVYRVSTQTVLCGPSPGAAAEGGRLGADWSPARALRAVWLWEELRGQPPGPLSHTPTDATLPGWSTPPAPNCISLGGWHRGPLPLPAPLPGQAHAVRRSLLHGTPAGPGRLRPTPGWPEHRSGTGPLGA